jgi:hypothetical protein
MRKHLVIPLLLYTALDFGNPLMPGAVSFQAGAIQVVPGDRAPRSVRLAEAVVRPVTVPPVWVAVRPDAVPIRPASMAPAPPPVPRVVRRTPPRILASQSPSEDH